MKTEQVEQQPKKKKSKEQRSAERMALEDPGVEAAPAPAAAAPEAAVAPVVPAVIITPAPEPVVEAPPPPPPAPVQLDPWAKQRGELPTPPRDAVRVRHARFLIGVPVLGTHKPISTDVSRYLEEFGGKRESRDSGRPEEGSPYLSMWLQGPSLWIVWNRPVEKPSVTIVGLNNYAWVQPDLAKE